MATKNKRFDLVGQIVRDIEKETGTKPPREEAQARVDQLVSEFHELYASLPDHAVTEMPNIARYLAWRWKGEDGRQLRDLLVVHHGPKAASRTKIFA